MSKKIFRVFIVDMRISFNNLYNNVSFCKKDKNIRKADTIQRLTRLAFPVLSATYADTFYGCLSDGSSKQQAASKISSGLMKRICSMRNNFAYAEKLAVYSQFDKKMIYILDAIAKNKIGNCSENAKLALAVLCANGYCNSALVGLAYEVKFINKKTNEVEYRNLTNLDHAFVITDLNERKEKDIIIDTWLGFAAYKEEATDRFKALYGEDLGNLVEMSKKLFRIEKMQKGQISENETIDFNDYEIRKGFKYLEGFTDNETMKEKEQLGELVRKKYPEVVLSGTV